MKIVLPWPDRRLSPNARVHRAVLASAKKTARQASAWDTKFQLSAEVRQQIAHGDERIPVRVTFYPPDKRHRDDDNAIAAFKAARDGIADGLGVDDRRFKPHYHFEEPDRPGRVEVLFL